MVPYCEMWLYGLTRIAIGSPGFLVIASAGDLASVADPAQATPEFYRTFCGTSIHPARYCVMRSLDETDGGSPTRWSFRKDTHPKSVLLGDQSPAIQISWISHKSGSGGSAFMPNHVGVGTFVGYGFGCAILNDGDPAMPTPIRVLFGKLPDDAGEAHTSSLDAVKAGVLSAMLKSATILEISKAQACQPSPAPAKSAS
jgi:hypothetical protein